MVQKPYVQKVGEISGFTVWIVDGRYVRSTLDEEFTNFGQHYRFRFIPKNELWIDKEYNNGNEIRYFIDHLLVEHRLMTKGVDYDTALARADRFEKVERKKSELFAKYGENPLLYVHKKFLKEYSQKLRVWIVNGELVRDFYFIDFTEGGHDLVYHFVPRNEVWLDSDANPREHKFILLHELRERNLMAQRLFDKTGKRRNVDEHVTYAWAHHQASEIEFFSRRHVDQVDTLIQEEMKKSIILPLRTHHGKY